MITEIIDIKIYSCLLSSVGSQSLIKINRCTVWISVKELTTVSSCSVEGLLCVVFCGLASRRESGYNKLSPSYPPKDRHLLRNYLKKFLSSKRRKRPLTSSLKHGSSFSRVGLLLLYMDAA